MGDPDILPEQSVRIIISEFTGGAFSWECERVVEVFSPVEEVVTVVVVIFISL